MLWFRDTCKEDYPAVDRLLMQLHAIDVQGRPEQFAPCDHYMSREAFENLLENDNILAFLVQEHGKVLGCCFVSVLEHPGTVPCKAAYIDLLVVDKDHRRQGIGREMFRYVRKCAHRMGADRVELMVWNYNDAAIRAYQSYGMTPQRSIYECRV